MRRPPRAPDPGLGRALALLLASAGAALAGCAPTAAPPATPASPPARVVVLGPSTAETLFALGLGDRVAGVSDYCVAPGAAGLPRLGGQWNPALERITALEPDLVVTQGEFPRLTAVLESLGIRHLALATDTWDSWEAEVRSLAGLFGVPDRGEALLAEKRAALEAVRQAGAGGAPPIPTLLVVGRRPGQAAGLVVAGGASFLDTLLAAAGGRNVFADNPRDYFDLDEEALVRAAPEVILELQPGRVADADVLLRTWREAFPALPAVARGRVQVLTEDFLLLPGPRMPEVAARLAAALRAPPLTPR